MDTTGAQAMNTREQYQEQKRTAQATADFLSLTLDLVLVKNEKHGARISILGNAINRAAFNEWKRQGSRVKKICTIKPSQPQRFKK
jgi:hypothetical protein